MHPDQLEGELYLAPGYAVPPNSDYKGYHLYIDENLPPESPYLYGLHPNAEIGVLTQTSEELFKTLLEMQPKDSGGGGAAGMSMEDKVKSILDDIMEKLPDDFNLYELHQKVNFMKTKISLNRIESNILFRLRKRPHTLSLHFKNVNV